MPVGSCRPTSCAGSESTSRRNLELHELVRAGPRLVLAVLGALAIHGALAAPVSADALEGVNQSIRLKQFAAAANELQRLAPAGNPDAQYLLGVFYLNGLNGPRDAALARPWLEKSAAQGNTHAALSLTRLSSPDEVADTGTSHPQQFNDPATRHEALWLAASRGDLQTVKALGDRDSLGA